MILLVVAQALCVGTTAICARRKGANDQKGANACLNQSMAIITVLGLLMTLAGYFGAEWLMKLAGANEDTLEISVSYFKIISLGLLFNCWSLCICAAMRAIGKTRITMVTNITANLVNVCLNYVLINGKLGFPRLGVRGAAIATVCGTLVSCLMAFRFACHKGGYYHLGLPKFDRTTLQSLGSVGSGSVLESACLRIGFFITAKMVAGAGTAVFRQRTPDRIAGILSLLYPGRWAWPALARRWLVRAWAQSARIWPARTPACAAASALCCRLD